MWRCYPPRDAPHSRVQFLDRWPRFADLDGSLAGTARPDRSAAKLLGVSSAVSDRALCVQTLENTSTSLEAAKARFDAPDLPPELIPPSVSIFIARARFVYSAVKSEYTKQQQQQPLADYFRPCRVCGRECLFRRRLEPDCLANDLEDNDYDDETSDSDSDTKDEEDKDHSKKYRREEEKEPKERRDMKSRVYWRECGGDLPTLRIDTAGCCSTHCFRSLCHEVQLAMGVSTEELDFCDNSVGKGGAAQVFIALRAALRRNELVMRRFRATQYKDVTHLTEEQFLYLRAMSAKMLSVDLAVIHAAAALSESFTLSRTKVLPPAFPNWRSKPELSYRAARACNIIYDKYRPMENFPVWSITIRPRFLTKSAERAHLIFNSTN